MSDLLEGTVERIDANLSRVRSLNTVYLCEIRKKLFRYGPLKTDVAVGDNVRFASLDEHGKGVIEEVLPRRTSLSRRTSMEGEEQVIAANIDQLVSVSSVRHPRLSLNLIDRYLVVAEKHSFQPVICVNKMDIAGDRDIHASLDAYEKIGYSVVLVSAKEGTNMAELAKHLAGRISILAGHSGVGKSSIINSLVPGVEQDVGEISRKWKKGKHITTAVSMFPLTDGGYIMDTPGIREFGLWDVGKQEIALYFREFLPFVGNCRFRNCVHMTEPGCAVRKALEEGLIDERRFESYVALYESTPDEKPWERKSASE